MLIATPLWRGKSGGSCSFATLSMFSLKRRWELGSGRANWFGALPRPMVPGAVPSNHRCGGPLTRKKSQETMRPGARTAPKERKPE